MHLYRTHTCGELRKENAGEEVKLSGWVFRKRDHGSLLFFDLRDNYGITQVVIEPEKDFFESSQKIHPESVVTIVGKVELREGTLVNEKLPTGEVEVVAQSIIVESAADVLPLYIAGKTDESEDLRLKYRFLDLRRERLHNNIILRSDVVSEIRRKMTQDHGFKEFETPILTSSSPEGARDFLVPSRLHPGKFYALPQSPQQYKQLLMLAGFDKYFQIAPCFRDEDARADRSPGVHYQLDMEMSFVTQDEVFAIVEDVLHSLFTQFTDKTVDEKPFKRIPYKESMLKYGSDKPDLRIPIEITDVSDLFETSGFNAFSAAVKKGGVVRAIPVKSISDKPRSFFDKLGNYAQELGSKGLAYLVWTPETIKGPIAKFMSEDELNSLAELCGVSEGDVIFFVCDKEKQASSIAGNIRLKLGADLDIIEKNAFRFCWIVDFPMFELDEETQTVEFSHNPFSMPQSGMSDLTDKNPLDILAYQYDIVCNGCEVASGAIRNHKPEIMYKAFEIAGYDKAVVDDKFGALIRAFKLGAPPHAGIAPGIDRLVMLISGEDNIREVIAFPMNQKAQDLMMNAPSDVSIRQLRELHLKLNVPEEKKKEE